MALPHRSSLVLMFFGFPFATTNDWPAWKYGIISTCFTRSAVMFWALMMMSHLPPLSAAMIVSNTEFSICASRPSRFAISWPISMSDPIGLPLLSKNSCGGYGMSEQMTSFPAKMSWSVGTEATVLGAADAGTDAAADPTALAELALLPAWQAASTMTAAIPPIAPFREKVSIWRSSWRARRGAGGAGEVRNLALGGPSCRGQPSLDS